MGSNSAELGLPGSRRVLEGGNGQVAAACAGGKKTAPFVPEAAACVCALSAV